VGADRERSESDLVSTRTVGVLLLRVSSVVIAVIAVIVAIVANTAGRVHILFLRRAHAAGLFPAAPHPDGEERADNDEEREPCRAASRPAPGGMRRAS
jgi:hypothetical protein